MAAQDTPFARTDSTVATYDRILDIAEALFATHGIQGTSIRQITDLAKVNVAAVNYHFGTKDKLVDAVIHRRFQSLEEERALALDRIEERCRREARAPRAEELAAVLVEPPFRHLRSGEAGWLNFIRVLARLTWEPGAEKFAPPPSSLGIFDRFDALLKLAVPALAGDDARRCWRLAFLRSASQQTMLTVALLREGQVPNAIAFAGALNQLPEEDVEKELIRFVTAGLSS
jgi:AcrR family transcriptional regulator